MVSRFLVLGKAEEMRYFTTELVKVAHSFALKGLLFFTVKKKNKVEL